MSRPAHRRAWRAAATLLVLAPGVAAAEGTSGPALDYAVTCQGCHRADGTGTPGTVPALTGSVGKFLRVPGGREFLVRVPGVAQAPLDDVALAAVLNWMLERFGRDDVPKGVVPYAAAEVGRLRRRPLTDVDGARRQLLEAIERAR
ncbi:MAG: cytochrome c [Deltaproteobacteria bacterium]|nr:MAG: cytochrome c [Deltaproteobacteria bacterium]